MGASPAPHQDFLQHVTATSRVWSAKLDPKHLCPCFSTNSRRWLQVTRVVASLVASKPVVATRLVIALWLAATLGALNIVFALHKFFAGRIFLSSTPTS